MKNRVKKAIRRISNTILSKGVVFQATEHDLTDDELNRVLNRELRSWSSKYNTRHYRNIVKGYISDYINRLSESPTKMDLRRESIFVDNYNRMEESERIVELGTTPNRTGVGSKRKYGEGIRHQERNYKLVESFTTNSWLWSSSISNMRSFESDYDIENIVVILNPTESTGFDEFIVSNSNELEIMKPDINRLVRFMEANGYVEAEIRFYENRIELEFYRI